MLQQGLKREVLYMKKLVILIVPIVLGFFVVVAVSADDVVQRELDALMEKWITSLSAEDIDAMMICYWPDVSDVTYDPNGQSYLLEGSSAIRQSQQE
jgi:hypothetical protein